MSSQLLQIEVNYPDLNNKELPHYMGCVFEIQRDQAKGSFLRTCFAEVTIENVVGFKRNLHPSCVWRVFYKRKDRTSDYFEKGSQSKKPIYPLPESDEQLKQLFDDISKVSASVGVKVLQKQYTDNREFAVVDYSPIFCSCPVPDSKLATEPPGMWSISEVTMELSSMKL